MSSPNEINFIFTKNSDASDYEKSFRDNPAYDKVQFDIFSSSDQKKILSVYYRIGLGET